MTLAPETLVVSDTLATGMTTAGRPVAIAGQGTGTVTSLALGTIAYGTEGSGWLSLSLSGAEAPATITVTPSLRDLSRSGTYRATVPVTSNAANSPRQLAVVFNVAPPPAPPSISGTVVVAGGNHGGCNGDLARASAAAVASVNPQAVFLMGDNATPRTGRVTTLQDYQDCFAPEWGRFLPVTWVALGEKEQDSVTGMADGADAFFGIERAGPPGRNYYSFNLGGWHIVVLNAVSGGPQRPVPYYLGSEQSRWLWDDLKANQGTRCTLVFWHDPLWQSSSDPPTPSDPWPNHAYRNQPMRGIWMYLYQWNADVVLNGGQHIYERFAPMRYEGTYEQPDSLEFRADSLRGIRQFTTGILGNGPVNTPSVAVRHPLSEYRSGGNGMLKLTLGSGEYTWEFINTRWSFVEDRGYGRCH